jgi:hypothetical protein
MKTALVWATTHCAQVNPYQCFGTTYQSYLQESRIEEEKILGFLTLADGTNTPPRNVGEKLPLCAA